MHVHGLRMLCVRECVVMCRCVDMQLKSPASGRNMLLVGAHQAKLTVNNRSTVTHPALSSGLARGVVITPLNARQTRNQGQSSAKPARQANTIVPNY